MYCGPLGPAPNRLELDRAAPTLRKGAANKSIECLVIMKEGNTCYKEKQVVEEFSEVWMILVTVRDRRRIY